MTQIVEGLPELPAEKEQVIAYLSVEYGMDKQVATDMVESWWVQASGFRGIATNREVGDRILDLDSEQAFQKMEHDEFNR